MPQGVSSAKIGAFQLDEGWESTGGDGGARGRGSELDKLLEQIRSGSQYHGTEIGIAVYEKANTAKGAVNSLRTRLGGPDASGFTFRTKFHKGKGMYAVTAEYVPGNVTEEGKQKHLAETKARKEKEKAARVAKQQQANQTVEDTTVAKAEQVQERVNEGVAA